MEKKDYLSLQSKYSFLSDYQERYRKDLLDYIREAFEKHGNEFEYKCDTHDSWEEKSEAGDFDAMNDLPTFMDVGIEDNYIHKVYPYRIRRYIDDLGYDAMEADGWDWYDSDWVEHLDVVGTIEQLQSVADFINAVLEQEQEAEFVYPRKFNKNEKVAVSEEHGSGYLAIVELEQHADDGEDIIGLYPIGEDGKCSLPPRQVKAKYVYQKNFFDIDVQ